MTIINIKCKHCGNNITFETNNKNISCPFCGSQYKISELLSHSEIEFLDKMKPVELESKIKADEHLKNGESFLYKAEYVSAEKEFYKAIDLDKDNYHGYFGVIRAKTHNFSILPEGVDFSELSKLALKTVNNEDYDYLKNELSKLTLLKKERQQQKAQIEKRKQESYKREKAKQKRSNIWSSIICALVFIATIIALIAVITKDQKDKEKLAQQKSTVEITTAAELINFSKNPEHLSATIIIKNDIDFGGGLWTPIGTAANPFTGKFYGNNYTISNINIADTDHADENYLGFFGFAKNATISGIKLSDAKINSTDINNYSETNYAGLIAARANNCTIKLCEITNSSQIVVTNKTKSTLIIGGVIGYAKDCIISNCYSNANITARAIDAEFNKNADSLKYIIGGVVGKLNNSGISYSYSSSTLNMLVAEKSGQPDTISLFAGGVVGSAENYLNKFYIKFCYFVGNIITDLTAEKSLLKTAGIVASVEQNLNILTNFCLYNNETFKQNNIYLNKTQLSDNDITIFDVSEIEIIKLITENFDNKVWTNTNTLLPTLKIERVPTQEGL